MESQAGAYRGCYQNCWGAELCIFEPLQQFYFRYNFKLRHTVEFIEDYRFVCKGKLFQRKVDKEFTVTKVFLSTSRWWSLWWVMKENSRSCTKNIWDLLCSNMTIIFSPEQNDHYWITFLCFAAEQGNHYCCSFGLMSYVHLGKLNQNNLCFKWNNWVHL